MQNFFDKIKACHHIFHCQAMSQLSETKLISNFSFEQICHIKSFDLYIFKNEVVKFNVWLGTITHWYYSIFLPLTLLAKLLFDPKEVLIVVCFFLKSEAKILLMRKKDYKTKLKFTRNQQSTQWARPRSPMRSK